MLPWILGNCTSSNSASDVGYDTQSGIKWDTLINWQTLEACASDHLCRETGTQQFVST